MGENQGRKVGEDPVEEKKRKKGGSKILSWIIIIVAAIVLVFALTQILDIGGENIASCQSYEALRKVATATGEPETAQGGTAADPRDRKIDFDALRAVNEDIIGWIYIPNTNIDYPVTIGEDNDYYLSHGADREQNRAGAIFLDYQNKPDFSDANTVVYGHRMNDGSMFASLHKFEDEAFFRENRYVYLYLPDGTVNVYDIFDASVVGDMDEAYTLGFENDDAFLDYLTKMKNRSAAAFNREFTSQDRIITLSTCIQYEDENRYIVQAVLEQQENA